MNELLRVRLGKIKVVGRSKSEIHVLIKDFLALLYLEQKFS